MSGSFRTILNKVRGRPDDNQATAAKRLPGPAGIALVGHREFVGGMWDELGRLQFDFLVSQGLQPSNVLVDIACGSLRAGVHLIPYLDDGNYLGIDKHDELVQSGLTEELPPGLEEAKHPEFVSSGTFEFDRFSKVADWALAQSLFSHLRPDLTRLCFANLNVWAAPGCRFFATFVEASSTVQTKHAVTVTEMEEFGAESGWSFRYIGEWGHPRQQVMTEYRKS